MATDFGSDVSANVQVVAGAYPDIDPSLAVISGLGSNRIVAEALLRRFTTPKGSLFYDQQYGYDVRLWMGETFSAEKTSGLSQVLETEATADERVLTCIAQVTFNSQTGVATAHLTVTTLDGPFNMVLAISAVTVILLKSG